MKSTTVKTNRTIARNILRFLYGKFKENPTSTWDIIPLAEKMTVPNPSRLFKVASKLKNCGYIKQLSTGGEVCILASISIKGIDAISDDIRYSTKYLFDELRISDNCSCSMIKTLNLKHSDFNFALDLAKHLQEKDLVTYKATINDVYIFLTSFGEEYILNLSRIKFIPGILLRAEKTII